MNTRILLGCSALALAAGMAGQAAAQGATQIEEVVVTARRAEENLQSTPVAVTAITAANLEQAQIVDLADVQRSAPNLTISTGAPAAPGFAIVTMRGQSNLNANSASDPAVGTYVDGVYIPRPAGTLLDLEDMERVEVLRGPQGTLFGRNTIGGALNLLTQQPKNTFEGLVSAEVGNYDLKTVRLMLNVPIVDGILAGRLNYKYTDHSGYGKNEFLGNDVNDIKDSHFARGHLKYTDPSGAWDLTLSADYNHFKTSGQLITLAGVSNTAPFAAVPGVVALMNTFVQTNDTWFVNRGQELVSTYPTFFPHEELLQYGYSAHLNADLGFAKFESITSWRYLDTEGSNDLDGTPVNILYANSEFATRSRSQEFKLSGGDGPLKWVGGFFYFKEKSHEQAVSRAFGVFGPGAPPVSKNDGYFDAQSMALYGQVYYNFTDALRLTAGYRYTWDKRKATLQNLNPFIPVPRCGVVTDPGFFCRQFNLAKFEYPSWVLGLDYQLNDNIFVYVNTSAASMSGGFNPRLGSIPAFRPEGAEAVEAGVKADWFDRRLRTNLAVFHTWQKDTQRNINTVFDVGFGPQSTAFVQNAGDAQIDGFELEVTAVPWTGMTLNAAVGYLTGDYDAGTFLERQRVNAPTTLVGCTLAPAGPGVPPGAADCLADRSGEPIPTLPEWSLSFGATQVLPTEWGDLTLHGDYSWVDDQFFSPVTSAPQAPAAIQATYVRANELNRMKAHGVFNAKATLNLQDTGVSLSAWARNLTNEKYVSRAQDFFTGLGIAQNFVGDPRTYGVTVTYRFGE